jgi:hypothetical protein
MRMIGKNYEMVENNEKSDEKCGKYDICALGFGRRNVIP